jgi:hypothetical protein
MLLYSALVKTFAMERRMRGHDSYEEFSRLRDIGKFLLDYEFGHNVYFLAGRSSLSCMLLPDARAYIRQAWKGGYRTFGAAWVYAKSLAPPIVHKAATCIYRRLVTRRWSRRVPQYIMEMLSQKNKNPVVQEK